MKPQIATTNEEYLAETNSVTIEGWVARDKEGLPSLFQRQSERIEQYGFWGNKEAYREIDLPKNSFPKVNW